MGPKRPIDKNQVQISHGNINGVNKTYMMEEKDRATLNNLRANAKNKDL